MTLIHATVVQGHMHVLTVVVIMREGGERVQDDKSHQLCSSSAFFFSSSLTQLTCGGNTVKGVHDNNPKSLTPWLALKTL